MKKSESENSVLFLGDIIGRVGRQSVKQFLPALRAEYQPDLIVANGENVAGGFGIDNKTHHELLGLGIDVLTSGNHIWRRKEALKLLSDSDSALLRPANFPEGSPGQGVYTFSLGSGEKIAVVNVQGRIFMSDLVDCPFRKMDHLLENELNGLKTILVDFHAEATSEKAAFANYLDGRVSLVVGTHTHVQTADERILPEGTGFISDAGMCGPQDSVIGMNVNEVMTRFISSMPARFGVAKGPGQVNGVFVVVNKETGKLKKIERIFKRE